MKLITDFNNEQIFQINYFRIQTLDLYYSYTRLKKIYLVLIFAQKGIHRLKKIRFHQKSPH